MEDLPHEMILTIMSCLDIFSVFNLGFVSKMMRKWIDCVRLTPREVYQSWLVKPRKLGLENFWLKPMALFEMEHSNIYYDRDNESYCDMNTFKPFQLLKEVDKSYSDNRIRINLQHDTMSFMFLNNAISAQDYCNLEFDLRERTRGDNYQEIIAASRDQDGFNFYDILYTHSYCGHYEGFEEVVFTVKPSKEKFRRLDALIIYEIKKPKTRVLH